MTPEAAIIEAMFRVANKEREDVDFILNSAQRELDATLSGRDIVPKARQRGISTYALARYTVKCLSERNTRAVVISHENAATQRMLSKVRYFIDNLRGPAPVIRNISQNRIQFEKTDSEFYIGTAGSAAFGRGDTISHLHCSEYAFWPNPAELLLGLLEAVPASGEVMIESTGNGAGTSYHTRCLNAYAGLGNWTLHFFPWHEEPEYRDTLTEVEAEQVLATLDPELEEDRLADILDVEQIAWRRRKIADMEFDLDRFRQEYPMHLAECFIATGSNVFGSIRYEETARWRRVDGRLSGMSDPKMISKGHFRLDDHPVPGCTYVLGGDVGAGVGRDPSAIEVYCVNTGEQVAEWLNDRVPPDELAGHVQDESDFFSNAFIVVENNNHGILTLKELRGMCPERLYHHSSAIPLDEVPELSTLGARTTERTKPLYVGRLRGAVGKKGETTIHSPILLHQMQSYVEDESGKMNAAEGAHDDLLMASAMAHVGMDQAAVRSSSTVIKEKVDPALSAFEGSAILEGLRKRGNRGLIPSQVMHGLS